MEKKTIFGVEIGADEEISEETLRELSNGKGDDEDE